MRFGIVLLAAACVAACSEDKAPLVATDVVLNKPMPGMSMSAGYLTLTNNSSEPITITRASSSAFAAVEIHESVIEDDIARMRPLAEVTIPPGEAVRFEPGGKHLMLVRPATDTDAVTVEFYSGPDVVLTIRSSLQE